MSKVIGVDLFGDNIEANALLRDIFVEPPFSILDAKGGAWQARKRKWNSIGLQSELGRDAECLNFGFENTVDADTGLDKYGRKPMTGQSIFDPALTELMYRWFCPPGGKILDPFAGGSVRGIVAAYLGFIYQGLELRKEQCLANEAQAGSIFPYLPKDDLDWLCGDSDVTLNTLPKESYDFIFSCPPYHDLEVYSDDPADLSNMPYDKFLYKYASIIKKACGCLKQNRFAVFVVGDIRDKNGFYKGFNTATKNCFRLSGALLYNECHLLQPLGTAMLRANKVFGSNKKLIKVHEDVLIFYKGDPNKIREAFAQ